jgi:hypothetical protein
MHDGHYLNLPVMNKESDEIVGMVDVLKLTYATLDQVSRTSAFNFYMTLTNHRSTACLLAMVRALPGTSSGCQWVTTKLDQ